MRPLPPRLPSCRVLVCYAFVYGHTVRLCSLPCHCSYASCIANVCPPCSSMRPCCNAGGFLSRADPAAPCPALLTCARRRVLVCYAFVYGRTARLCALPCHCSYAPCIASVCQPCSSTRPCCNAGGSRSRADHAAPCPCFAHVRPLPHACRIYVYVSVCLRVYTFTCLHVNMFTCLQITA